MCNILNYTVTSFVRAKPHMNDDEYPGLEDSFRVNVSGNLRPLA